MAGGRGIVVGAIALAVAGGVGAAWLSSTSGGGTAPIVASTTRSDPARRPTSVGASDVLATLPLASGTGRILLTTPSCRLGLLDLRTRRTTSPRSDVDTCAARFGGRTGAVALVQPKERTATTTVTRLAGRSADDRTVRLPGLLEELAIGPSGAIAACAGGGLADAARTTLVLTAGRNGSVSSQVPGCNPAWWDGRLAWIDRRDRLLSGSHVIRLPPDTFPETIGASADGRVLAVLSIVGRSGVIVTVLRAPGEEPVRRLVLREPPALSSPTIRIAADGEVLALRDDDGRWSLYRTDGSVPPARDVAGAPMLDVAFAPDARFVAAIAGGRLVFLDPTTLGPVAQLPVSARTIDWAP